MSNYGKAPGSGKMKPGHYAFLLFLIVCMVAFALCSNTQAEGVTP